MQNPTDTEIKDILLNSKRIAVVGLSNNPNRTSYTVSEAMQNAGYTIIPVNPNADKVLGEKAVARLQDIEGHVDIVNVFRRSEFLPEVAKDAVEIGTDVFWAQLGVANAEAYDYLQEQQVTTVMDRCIKVEHTKVT
ncbi:CoA-binding protein [Shouchella shacheensis]|uniref:CoA-binding protein n=1 Tax=Shouchella shacheensis TaxID=1649580 RepID=UPI0007403676|nr:CoA-binding protein [Shouchella shacheensis]